MEQLSLLLPILLSSLLGLTGYLKEMRENVGGVKSKILGGTRTFFIISLLGMFLGYLYSAGYIMIAIIFSVVILILPLIFFSVTLAQGTNVSFSDELSIFVAFILSFLWMLRIFPDTVLIAAFIGVMFIMEQRETLLSLGKKVSTREASQIIAFLATALIILPFLPDRSFSFADLGIDPALLGFSNEVVDKIVHLGLLNPYKIWYIVVFVSGIDILGYILKKIFAGSTSDLLPAIIGGFVSSTSTTIGLASKSTKVTESNSLVAGAVLANMISFVQLLILMAPISVILLKSVLPFILGVVIFGTLYAWYLLRGIQKKATPATSNESVSTTLQAIDSKQSNEEGKIFNLGPAVKFALLLSSIKIIANISLVVIGTAGFIATSAIASLAGVDAVIITMAELVNRSQITIGMAIIVFVIINAINFSSKAVYSYLSGSRDFFWKLVPGLIIMLVGGGALQFIVNLF